MFELFGYVGNLLLAVCSIPQSIKCWRDQHANGLSWWFILIWISGEFLGFVYVLYLHICTDANLIPMIINYSINCCSLSYILYIKIKGTKNA